MNKRWLAGLVSVSGALVGASETTAQAPSMPNYDGSEYLNAAFGSPLYFGSTSFIGIRLLSRRGHERAMLRDVQRRGFQILSSDHRMGYAVIQIERNRVQETLQIRDIEYWGPTTVLGRAPDTTLASERQIGPPTEIRLPNSRVDRENFADGPYFPSRETGLDRLWERNPNADGTGVRIALADEFPDPLHPTLQAVSIAGRLAPKVLDLDPGEVDDTWIRFGPPLTSSGGRVSVSGLDWILPRRGRFSFGIFQQAVPIYGEQVTAISLNAGAIWDERTGEIWFDTNGNRDFRDERALRDYSVRHDIGWFGHSSGSDDHRIGFAVKIRPDARAAYLAIGGRHGTACGSTMAANRLTGGLFRGAAPNAQIIAVPAESTFRGPQANYLRAFHQRADVVSGYGIGPLGGDPLSRALYQRAIEAFDTVFIGRASVPGSIRVDTYASAEMLRRTAQARPPYGEVVDGFDTQDAGHDGLVNTILVPSWTLTARMNHAAGAGPWSDGRWWQRGGSPSSWNLWLGPPAPRGYSVDQSFSCTTSRTAGIVADLIAAARHAGVRYDARRLAGAMFTGAHLVPGIATYLQGFGLVDADNAWRQLDRMNAADAGNARLTYFKMLTNEGGSSANGFVEEMSGSSVVTRDFWLVRHGGPSGPRRYRLGLRGDTESFELADQSVVFPQDVRTRVRFRFNGGEGIRRVFLQLEDADAGTIMQEVPITIRVPNVPQFLGDGLRRYDVAIEPLRSQLRLINFDRSALAARMTISMPYTGAGRRQPTTSTCFIGRTPCSALQTLPVVPGAAEDFPLGAPVRYETLFPPSHHQIQSVFIGNRNLGGNFEAPAGSDRPIGATLIVEEYGMSFGTEGISQVQFRNALAPVVGRVEFFGASVARSVAEADGRFSRVGSVQLPNGIVQWRVRVSSQSMAGEDAEIFVLHCEEAETRCTVVSTSRFEGAVADLAVDQPSAGIWQIVVHRRNATAPRAMLSVEHAPLVSVEQVLPIQRFASHESRVVGRPTGVGTPVQYVGFRMFRTLESNQPEMLVAVTALDRVSP